MSAPAAGAETVLLDAVRSAGEWLGAGAEVRDRESTFDRERWQRCGDLGLLGLPLAASDGGAGLTTLGTVRVLEELGASCRDHGLVFAVASQLWSPITALVRFGSPAQRERRLGDVLAGRWILAQAVTERGSGSDAMAVTTTAVDDAQGWSLTGAKAYVTCAAVADELIVLARTDRAGPFSLTAFLVPVESAGVSIRPAGGTTGLRTAGLASITLDDVRLPLDSQLGRLGGGAAMFEAVMAVERAGLMAPLVGMMQWQLDVCTAEAAVRRRFGRPIGEFQAISHRLAEMATRCRTARVLVRSWARARDDGQRERVGGAMVKLVVSEAAVASALDAVQIFGAQGYVTGALERSLRDVLAARIYGGTSDMMRELIAGSLGTGSRP